MRQYIVRDSEAQQRISKPNKLTDFYLPVPWMANSLCHMSGFAQPRQKFARKGENCNFEIAVIFYPVKETF